VQMPTRHEHEPCMYACWEVYSVIRTDICTWVSFKQISGESVGEVKVVADMHQRKAEMARQSEAFVALPGA